MHKKTIIIVHQEACPPAKCRKAPYDLLQCSYIVHVSNKEFPVSIIPLMLAVLFEHQHHQFPKQTNKSVCITAI